MYKSCSNCRRLTQHEVGDMDGTGRRLQKCLECGHSGSKTSHFDRIENEKRNAEKYQDRTFNEVVESVNRERDNQY